METENDKYVRNELYYKAAVGTNAENEGSNDDDDDDELAKPEVEGNCHTYLLVKNPEPPHHIRHGNGRVGGLEETYKPKGRHNQRCEGESVCVC